MPRKKIIVPIYIEKFLTPSMTFIYRQVNDSKSEFEKIIFTSSKVENLELFPFKNLKVKSKNLIEYVLIKFYEKILRDRICFSYHKILSLSQKKYFTREFSKINIGFIHTHFGTAALEIYPVLKQLRKKIIISFHGYDASQKLNSKSYVNHLKRIFEDCHVITSSKYMLRKLETVFGKPKKAYTIYYGIPLDFYKEINRKSIYEKMENGDKIRFLQVSNFVEKKGHKYSVEAFADTINQYKNVELVFGGDGELRYDIEKLAKQLNIYDKVKFLGRVNQNQVNELMSNSDVFIHHSVTSSSGDQEGIPNVIMEAMATGLPVISTIHAGIPELIQDKKNGFLINERDVHAYISVIHKLLNNDYSYIAYNARKTIEEKFNLDIQNKKIDDVYHELMMEGDSK